MSVYTPAQGTAAHDARTISVPTILGAAVVAICAGVVVGYGLARDDTLSLLLGAGVFAPLVVACTHGTANAVDDNHRAAGALAFFGLSFLFMVVIIVTKPWWGDSASASGPPLHLAASDPSAHVYLRRVPAGKELSGPHDPQPVVPGKDYRFECQVVANDHTTWLRLSDGGYWAPAATLVTPTGKAAKLPTC